MREAAPHQGGRGRRAPRSSPAAPTCYPNMKRRQQTPKVVIGLSRIAALRRLRLGTDGLAIGAGVPLSDDRAPSPHPARAIPGLVARDRGDLDAAAAQHGHARRQRPARHALQLLRPELRVAPGDRLLHEEGRRRSAGSRPGSPKCLAVQSADSVPVLIALGATRGARLAGGRARGRARGSLPQRRHPLPDEAAGRAPDGDPGPERRTAGRRPTGSCAAAARSTSRCSRSGPRSAARAGRVVEARIVLGAVASAPVRAARGRGDPRGPAPRRRRPSPRRRRRPRARPGPWTTPISRFSGARR